MSTFTEMEEQRLLEIRRASEQEHMVCPKCGSAYFSVRIFGKYRGEFPVWPGDPPMPVSNAMSFHVLECLCGELFEVKSTRINTGSVEKDYDKFLDQVEKSSKVKDAK